MSDNDSREGMAMTPMSETAASEATTRGTATAGEPVGPPHVNPAHVNPAQVGFAHVSVMAEEVTAVLSVVPDGWVIDATLGGGGHAQALLNTNPGISILGLDQDQSALDAAGQRLASAGTRVQLCHTRFDQLGETVNRLNTRPVTGALFDLGVSSPQLDRGDRGFSFRHDGPLDMRMDQTSSTTAADLVNTLDERALSSLLTRHADERHARRIARAIVAARPISTTGQLAEIVRDAVPAAARRSGGHPARKTFQALRIEVNEELVILADALRLALDLLEPGGRCAVLSYHSGEDRIVKQVFRDASGDAPRPRADLPPPPGSEATVKLLWRGAVRPSEDEIAKNPRAEAARFRAVEKLQGAA
jgi:16S rRNA (cytosine1402-N4)-methyltransferase